MNTDKLAQAAQASHPDSQNRPRLLLTVRQFSETHPAFSQGAIRNLIFLAKSRKTSKGTIHGNGLDVALVRIGRKVLIDEVRFFEWVDDQQGGK